MKKIFSVLVAALMGFSAAHGCMKKNSVVNLQNSELTVIVMDTTQSLLNGAEVKIGKTVWTTSFDGRVVIKPEQIGKAKSLTVSHSSFESRKVSLDGNAVAIVSLTPKPRKTGKDKGGKEEMAMTLGATRRSGVVYNKMMVAAGEPMAEAATMDYATMEPMPEVDMPPRILPDIPVPNNVQAGMLTAGEVNDFAKWALWSAYLDSAISYQQTWGLTPKIRYTIQVTNKNGYPFASRAVSLLDEKGNTRFQAVTDNTGKAELWGEGTQIRVEDQVIAAKSWGEGINALILDEPCSNGQPSTTDDQSDVDVLFIFDATGSMGDELRYLQAEMKDVIARASNATGGLAIRTGAVVYRDHGDEYLTRISRLTTDLATTQTFIDKQSANGGGDYPEAIPEALMAALNSAGWDSEARARIAFLVLDAPCHRDSATLALLHEQILNAAALGVRLVPVVCSGLDESGEYLLRSMALMTNGTSFFLTDDSGIGHTHLKPTTDTLKVEHLNDMLVRTIVEFSMMPDCTGHWTEEAINTEGDFVPNPFEIKDLTEEEIIAKDSPTTLYLIDISGKLIHIYQGRLEDASDSQLSRLHLPMLSTGVYFVKAFYDGAWHTKKILVH